MVFALSTMIIICKQIKIKRTLKFQRPVSTFSLLCPPSSTILKTKAQSLLSISKNENQNCYIKFKLNSF